MSDADIAKGFGMTINQMRAKITVNNETWRKYSIPIMEEMLAKGMSKTKIAEEVGLPYQTTVSILKDIDKAKQTPVLNTKEALKAVLDEGYVVDYGKGVERYLGVSETTLMKAALALEADGYNTYSDLKIPQVTNENQLTPTRLIAPKNIDRSDILEDMTMIKLPFEYSEDGGKTFVERKPPVNISRDRIYVRYREDGGADRDGAIELRRGVKT
jgi:predicted transcriptional regulator